MQPKNSEQLTKKTSVATPCLVALRRGTRTMPVISLCIFHQLHCTTESSARGDGHNADRAQTFNLEKLTLCTCMRFSLCARLHYTQVVREKVFTLCLGKHLNAGCLTGTLYTRRCPASPLNTVSFCVFLFWLMTEIYCSPLKPMTCENEKQIRQKENIVSSVVSCY